MNTLPRQWAPPSRRAGRCQMVAAAGGAPVGLCELADGYWSAVDVAATFPAGWDDVVIELVAKWEGAESVIARTTPARADGAILAGGGLSCCLFSVRGVPASSYVVRAYPIGANLEAFLSLEAWGEDGAPSHLATRQQVDLFASPAQQVDASAALALAAPVVFFPPTVGRRVALTRIVISSGDAGLRAVTLSELPAVGASIPRSRYIVASNRSIVEHFTYPLRAARGSGWQFELVPALAGTMFANLTGIES